MCWRMWEECDGAHDSIVSSSSHTSDHRGKPGLAVRMTTWHSISREKNSIDDPPITMNGENLPPARLQMNRLSLRNNRLKFKTAGKCAEECGKNVIVPVIQSYLLATSHTSDHRGKPGLAVCMTTWHSIPREKNSIDDPPITINGENLPLVYRWIGWVWGIPGWSSRL